MAVRDRRPTSHAALGPSPQTRHFRRCAGFIDTYQPFGIEIRLSLAPCAPPREHVGPILLAGVRRFFSRSLSDDRGHATWKSEERRVGKEVVRTFRIGGGPIP